MLWLDQFETFIKTRDWSRKAVHIAFGCGCALAFYQLPWLGVGVALSVAALKEAVLDMPAGESLGSSAFDIVITTLPAFLGFVL